MMDMWKDMYMKNAVAIQTLEKLVAAGKLTRDEVDAMVAERLEKYGF